MEFKNVIQIRGVVKNAETFPYEQKTICRFTVLTRYAYSNKKGENVFEDTRHNCTVFSGQKITPETIRKIKPGAVVYVTGRQRHIPRKKDSDPGDTRAEIYVSDITIHKAGSRELNISQTI